MYRFISGMEWSCWPPVIKRASSSLLASLFNQNDVTQIQLSDNTVMSQYLIITGPYQDPQLCVCVYVWMRVRPGWGGSMIDSETNGLQVINKVSYFNHIH